MIEKPEFDLSKGINGLVRGMNERFPTMNHHEMEELSNVVLEMMGNAFYNGEQLASFKTNQDGGYELRVWNIGEIGGGQ